MTAPATPDAAGKTPCPTCSGTIRETMGMVCQTCGTDYAADQTPATDSEPLRRDDWERRYRAANDEANSLAVRVVTAEDEAARLTALLAERAATIERVIDRGLIQPAEWLGDKRTFTGELAEEPGNDAYMAYIERVLTASGYTDIPWGPVTLAIALDRLVRENEKAAALGSQRTEGQG